MFRFDPAWTPYFLLLPLPVLIGTVLRLRQKLRGAFSDLESTRRHLEESQSLAKIGNWELDLLRDHLSWSAETFRIFELDPTRFSASYETFLDLVHPEDRDAVNNAFLDSIRKRSSYETIHRLVLPDGRTKILRERGRTVYDEKTGDPIRSFGTVQDISREVALNLEAGRERAFAASLLDAAPAIVLLLDSNRRIRHVNRCFESLTGYTMADVTGLDWFSTLIPEEDRERCLRIFAEVRAGAFIQGITNTLIARNGQRLHIEWHARPLSDKEVDDAGILAVGLDVSHRRELELRAAETQERLHQVMQSLPAWLAVCTPEGRIIEGSQVALDMADVTADEIEGMLLWESPWARTSVDTQRRIHDAMLAAAQGGTIRGEFTLWRAPTRIGIIDVTICPIFNAGGHVQYVVAFGMDITQRKEAEAAVLSLNDTLSRQIVALKESEQRFERTFRGNPIAMNLKRLRDDVILDVNEAFEVLFGGSRDQFIGRSPAELNAYVNPHLRPPILAKLNRGERIPSQEIQLRTLSGKIRTTLVTAEVIQFGGDPCSLTSFVDITERIRADIDKRTLEAQLNESRKLEALGTFANGIAHDFRNILAVIMGNTDALKPHVSEEGAVHVKLMELASLRGSDLVKRLSMFARGQRQKHKHIDLNAAVRESCELLKPTVPKSIQLELRISPGIPVVLSDANQVHQIVSNLISNAVQAIGSNRGTITVTLDRLSLETPKASRLGQIAPGCYVVLTVTDSGPGVDPSLHHKIFEPFFSTRSLGAGTGLGLAVVDGIVRAHSGHLFLDPAVTKGASFQIWLPAARQDATALVCPTEPYTHEERRDPLRILIIEDDAAVAATIDLATRARQWIPTTVLSSTEAIRMIAALPDAWDAVIADYSMPEASGLDITRAVMTVRDTLPVVIYSGEMDTQLEDRALAAGARAAFSKDVRIETLLDAVERATDSGRSSFRSIGRT